MKHQASIAITILAAIGAATALAQTPPAPAPPATVPRRGGPPPAAPLGEGPWDLSTERGRVHVSVVTRGVDHPWGFVFLPDGSMLVTERPGRLRLVRNGLLVPEPIGGLPKVLADGLGGLMDIALHPHFAQNHLLYITYAKPAPDGSGNSTTAVLRARWDGGSALSDVRDIFVADSWYGALPLPKRCCGQGPAGGSYGSRLAFDRQGFLYVTLGDRNYGERVQDPSNDYGKIIRLRDDGGIPADNPFVGKAGWRPEIWSTGHRNPLGLFYDRPTGTLWESEFGPRGGDEVNRIERGRNYGWIDVTQGQHYNNEPAKGVRDVPGMTDPVMTWVPSINPGNLLIYRGRTFPQWRGDLLMPTMTRSVLRASFDKQGRPVAQERMLTELKQRFRDIKVGPDGDLYLLTDEKDGAILKIEPAR